MAISKKTQQNYNSANYAYNESNETKNARNSMNSIAAQMPVYTNSYANQLNDMYKKIKSGKEFSYDPNNDVAYRRFADEYNALSGLAIAQNQQQALDLSGGYGSSYAAEVANQGEARLKSGVEKAQPIFMEQAQKAYMANTDALVNAYEAGAKARNDELDRYKQAADNYNDRYKLAQQNFSDSRNLDYNKYKDNRDYWTDQYDFEVKQDQFDKELAQKDIENQRDYELKSYDVYNKLAATKCADYKEAQDNSGMKAYLDGLVSAGKITQYMADNLYKQYKYVAPVSSGGGGGRSYSGGSGSGSGSGGSGGTGTTTTNTNASWFPTPEQILALGYGPLSRDGLMKLINSGDVILDVKNKTVKRTVPKQAAQPYNTLIPRLN